uniref:uncharacterized protein LOC131132575 n=1 Tax=Doryrhamphus excisus TaxID=161450 RepID=UPI0025AE1F06|nr:uncharacterized protein LOC131132575 [Doryrhamphus excisus]
MAVWVSSGAWLLLLLLAGAAYSHPLMHGPKSFPGSQASKPAFTPELSVSGAKPRSSYEGPHQPARVVLPPSGNLQLPGSFPPGGLAPHGSLDLPGSSVMNAPVLPGYVHDGHVVQSDQFPGPLLPPFHPQYQPGELFRTEKTLEQGHNERETKSKGPPQLLPLPLDTAAPSGPKFSMPPPPPFPYGFLPYPFDRNFLTGQYPPGTLSHFSTSFERGRNYNHDIHYETSEEDDDDDEPIKHYLDYAPQNLVQPGAFRRWQLSNFRRDPSSQGDYNPYKHKGQGTQVYDVPQHSRLTRVRH